jgi:rubrerythrin
MTMSLEEALHAALDDEYHARATYRAVLDAFGEVRPFINIVESEERHIEALKRQCGKHGIEIPSDKWAGRVSAPESLRQACENAVKAERDNARLYEKLIEAAREHPDVQETFRRMREASQERHLPAFERAAGREGGGDPGDGGGRRRRRRHRGGSG